jgi:hypothetical protein
MAGLLHQPPTMKDHNENTARESQKNRLLCLTGFQCILLFPLSHAPLLPFLKRLYAYVFKKSNILFQA